MDVILAGTCDQAQEYARHHRLHPATTVVVDNPEVLRGLRGPILVHRLDSFTTDRSHAYQERVWKLITVIHKHSACDA